ncbi:polysaccharide deacetylase family protein [Devosia sp. 2618]|uniref:polysaccharide deacetylase family protein n=1 Tax=Devosia sp. 2618 TaxID=3156454 RepID=UPI003395D1A8
MRAFLLACALLCAGIGSVSAAPWQEPSLHLSKSDGGPRVAITLDACMGSIDTRILNLLLTEKIPVTLFVTERWLHNNPETIAVIAKHPDLFDIENHGRNHVPAVTGTEKPYGITPAGTLVAVDDEVLGGSQAIQTAFGTTPTWFRGATALYTPDAMDEIGKLGFNIAGFSLNADFGATASADKAEAMVKSAKDGDVLIAHINQPTKAAGDGVARGLLFLKQHGYQFVRLGDLR